MAGLSPPEIEPPDSPRPPVYPPAASTHLMAARLNVGCSALRANATAAQATGYCRQRADPSDDHPEHEVFLCFIGQSILTLLPVGHGPAQSLPKSRPMNSGTSLSPSSHCQPIAVSCSQNGRSTRSYSHSILLIGQTEQSDCPRIQDNRFYIGQSVPKYSRNTFRSFSFGMGKSFS